MADYIVTVSMLNEYVNGLLSADPLLKNIGVKGEIGGYKRHTSGHIYFSLKDESSLVKCVMFRQNAYQLDFVPSDGMQVIVTGYVSLYTKDGQYQFYATSMQKAGDGELYRRFMQLKAKLETKGYFDQDHKKSLPFLPSCVGVVTSASGAAIQDIKSVIWRRFPSMHILLYPVKVQGEGAAREIAAGINALNWDGRADVLLVGRGGGSMEDLFAFNDECVAQAIYESDIPVISAVGHETDFTIADFVADMRAPTPSAAAELCVPELAALQEGISRLKDRITSAAAGYIGEKKREVHAVLASAAFAAAGHKIGLYRQQLFAVNRSITTTMESHMVARYNSLERLKSALDTLNPLRILDKGYAFVRDQEGHPVRSAANLRPEQNIDVVFSDGIAYATINDIKTLEESHE